MKIALIGDLHLGHGWGSELEEDCFRQAEEAFDIAIREKADLIIIPGDIFDSRIPRQEVLARAFQIFQKPLLAEKNHAKLIECENGAVSPLVFRGIPVIAIAGTHERRGGNSVNAVQTLGEAGYLICLDRSGVSFEIGQKSGLDKKKQDEDTKDQKEIEGQKKADSQGTQRTDDQKSHAEKIYIYGVGGVPEDFAKKIFFELKCKPKNGHTNFFLFHQSLTEYIPQSEEGNCLSKKDLPAGFDFYVDGHIHWADLDGNLILTGSTVITQQRKNEMEKKKGIWIIEGQNPKFIELQKQRPFFFDKVEVENASPSFVIQQCRDKITKLMSSAKTNGQKPLIRLNLSGTLSAGTDLNESEITKGFDAIVSLNKDIQNEDFKKKIEILRELQAKKLSVEEQGFGILQKLLEQTNYKGIAPHEIFEDLSEGETDAVVKRITERFNKR